MITLGPDGNLWFAESPSLYDAATNTLFPITRVAKMTPAGDLTEYDIADTDIGIFGIAAGPDGNVWFTEYNGNNISVITPDGQITRHPIPSRVAHPLGIATGADGNLWFTEESRQDRNLHAERADRRAGARRGSTSREPHARTGWQHLVHGGVRLHDRARHVRRRDHAVHAPDRRRRDG